MKKLASVLLVAILLLSLAGFASAVTLKPEAQSCVKRGVAYLKANGKVKALAEFSNEKGQFVKGELYIYVVDRKGVVIAHGRTPKLIGKNMYDLKDASGKRFIQDILRLPSGSGWIEYRWLNPVSGKIEDKIAYTESVDGMFIICGVYR